MSMWQRVCVCVCAYVSVSVYVAGSHSIWAFESETFRSSDRV